MNDAYPALQPLRGGGAFALTSSNIFKEKIIQELETLKIDMRNKR